MRVPSGFCLHEGRRVVPMVLGSKFPCESSGSEALCNGAFGFGGLESSSVGVHRHGVVGVSGRGRRLFYILGSCTVLAMPGVRKTTHATNSGPLLRPSSKDPAMGNPRRRAWRE